MTLPANPDVRSELWSSFVSLLRSYAAVASLHGVAHQVLVLSDTSLYLQASQHTLKLSYHTTLGRGIWWLHQGTDRHLDAIQPRQSQQGAFEIHPDGSVTLDGESSGMDLAAIQLVACLTHAVGEERNEVPV